MGVEIWTDFNAAELSAITQPIPKSVMVEIGNAYRKYREKVLLSRRQMHDLSAMPPLKPETIEHKRGIHKSVDSRGGINASKTLNAVQRESLKRKTVTKGSLGRHQKGYISQYPETPLMDSGNLSQNVVIGAKDGELTLTIGPQRNEIGMYHEFGMGHNPARVHHSWNEEFIETQLLPIVIAHQEKTVRHTSGGMKKIA
jgi:hypothetical protein